ncbi:MAG: FHA domain-containing protein [Candidatus Eisenbacteria bacterium]|nr:FHA domain-containing protein [Candidatus Eisenbacteria bacterium]
MLRLTVSQPGREARQVTFHGEQVTVGRSTENQLVLDDEAVSGRHGRFERRGRHLVYCDVGSTNGSIVHRAGKALALTGRQVRGQILAVGDWVKMGSVTVQVESNDPLLCAADPQVVESRSLDALAVDDGHSLRSIDLRQTERILALIGDAKAALGSFDRLTQTIRDHLVRFFPQATHVSIVVRDPVTGSLRVVYHDGKGGEGSGFRISHTMVNRVMRDQVGVLLAEGGKQMHGAQSIVSAGIETAICAPLRNVNGTFGALQLDVRGTRGAVFSGAELSLLLTLSDFIALLLDDARQHENSARGFLVALDRLLRERAAAEPAQVATARRAASLSTAIARTLRLSVQEQDLVHSAALLLAWPAPERPSLVLPDAFAEAPFIAICRDESVDGSGPLGLTLEQLPIGGRILSLVWGLLEAIAEREHSLPSGEDRAIDLAGVLTELVQGRDQRWDGACLDALSALTQDLDRLIDRTRYELAA